MRKNRVLAYTIYAVVLLVFHLLVFTIIQKREASFWINYGFALLAFLIQPIIWEVTLGRKDSLKSKFLGFPTLYVGCTYFCVQMILFVILALTPNILPFLALVINAMVTGIAIIFLAIVETGKSEISRIDEKVSQKRSFIEDLQIEVEMLAMSQTETPLKNLLEELAGKIRFSDPMSSSILSDVEEDIRTKVLALKGTKKTAMGEAVKDIEILITRRNKLVKVNK